MNYRVNQALFFLAMTLATHSAYGLFAEFLPGGEKYLPASPVAQWTQEHIAHLKTGVAQSLAQSDECLMNFLEQKEAEQQEMFRKACQHLAFLRSHTRREVEALRPNSPTQFIQGLEANYLSDLRNAQYVAELYAPNSAYAKAIEAARRSPENFSEAYATVEKPASPTAAVSLPSFYPSLTRPTPIRPGRMSPFSVSPHAIAIVNHILRPIAAPKNERTSPMRISPEAIATVNQLIKEAEKTKRTAVAAR